MASTDAQTSLSVAKTGTGVTVDFLAAKKNVSMVCYVTGISTGGVVAVEASQDAVNWVGIVSFEMDSSRARSFDSSRGAYRYWRATILDAVKGGGTVSATFMEAD